MSVARRAEGIKQRKKSAKTLENFFVLRAALPLETYKYRKHAPHQPGLGGNRVASGCRRDGVRSLPVFAHSFQ